MSFSQPYNYDPMTGRWYLEIQKTPKDIFSQCGIKITIDPGIPTGESGAFYKPDEKSGMMGANIEFRCFDNLAGWTSAVAFDFNTFIQKLIEMMPEGTVKTDTFLLAQRDLEYIENKKKKEQNNG
jgi:hypothetical protein